MEETLRAALLAGGERLAEALRFRLSEQGFPSELQIVLDGDRLVIASQSAELRLNEVGFAGFPPKALLEGFAQDAVPQVLEAVIERLGSITR